MCGIFSIINPNSQSKDNLLNIIQSGLRQIEHRGPDANGVWVDPQSRIGFGHVRLTIVDLDSGAQPMSLDNGTTIIFNGEIYNYIELREELGLDLFQTHSDTEVILHAYQKWGEDCVQHLRGMFAFLIWD